MRYFHTIFPNVLIFSDTVIFWSNDDSIESLEELIEVSYKFNYQSILYQFPVRGTLLYDEIVHDDFRLPNEGGGIYNINSVFGKGIVDAYKKTGQQNWAGTVIDKSITKFLNNRKVDSEEFLKNHAKKYVVPYKEEYALRLTKEDINEETFNNTRDCIKNNFSNHNKNSTSQDVQTKLENTLKYLESFKQNGNTK